MRRTYAVLAVLVAAAVGLTWLVEPNLIVGLRSPRALAWAAAVGAGCLVVGLVARRLGASALVALAAGALPGVVAAGLFVVRPIVAPRTLTEALPSTAASLTSPGMTGPETTGAETTGSAPAGRVAGGTLRGLAGHSARGSVATYRLADGTYVVRFESVDIGGTPDPEVYVLAGADRTGKSGGTHLGALKAEKGTFHYALPASFAGGTYTVVVWCERFGVDIAHATQA